MTLDCTLRASMRQTAYVARFIGNSAAGDPAHNAPAAFMCRCDASHALVMGSNAEEETATHEIICTAPIKEKDLIFVPGANPYDMSQGRMPKRIDVAVDEFGDISHYEVLV
jgi:hypothetical protein